MKIRNFASTIQLVTAPVTPDTDFTVAHELGVVPRGAFVVRNSGMGVLYTSSTLLSGLNMGTNFIAGWEFEDNSALGADSGPNGLTLTNSGATQITGKVGSGVNFVSASSQYLYRASEALLQMGNISFTWAAWVRLTNKLANYMIISKESTPVALNEFDLYYDLGVGIDKFHGRVWLPSGASVNVYSTTFGAATAGVWYFVVVWHDATADTLNMQVNNGAVDSVATGGSLQAASTAQLQFAARDNAGSRSFSNGDLDQVMFWKRVLTAAERTALYNSGTGVTVANAIGTPTYAPIPWTNQLAYLRSSVSGAQYYVVFFI